MGRRKTPSDTPGRKARRRRPSLALLSIGFASWKNPGFSRRRPGFPHRVLGRDLFQTAFKSMIQAGDLVPFAEIPFDLEPLDWSNRCRHFHASDKQHGCCGQQNCFHDRSPLDEIDGKRPLRHTYLLYGAGLGSGRAGSWAACGGRGGLTAGGRFFKHRIFGRESSSPESCKKSCSFNQVQAWRGGFDPPHRKRRGMRSLPRFRIRATGTLTYKIPRDLAPTTAWWRFFTSSLR